MSEFLTHFHFLRPLLLLALVPGLLLLWLLWHWQQQRNNWQQVIAPNLLRYLSDGASTQIARWPLAALSIGWLLATLALAGPSWEQRELPVHQRENALVIVLDLSLSMLAEDVSPSRVQRAKFKILDLLKQRREGQTALVVYAADAHTVAPLTDDNDTVTNLTKDLDPQMMPKFGSDPAAAIKQSIELLTSAGVQRGKILLLTDDMEDDDVERITDRLTGSAFQLNIIGVGSEQGAPIPTSQGLLRDDQGNIVIATVPRHRLQRLAQNTGGSYHDLSLNDSDIASLSRQNPLDGAQRKSQRQVAQWYDRGALFVLPLLPLALLAFRRGWLLLLPLLFFLPSPPAMAFEWQSMWQRPDQRGADLLQQGNAEDAAKQFKDPQWQGVADYQAGDYDNAAEKFRQDTSANGFYNLGNALAKSGKLSDAIDAYTKALQQDPELQAAADNKKLVQQLLQQQEQQQKSDSGDKSGQQDKNGEPQSGDKQSQDESQQSGQKSDGTENSNGKGENNNSDGKSQNNNQQDSSNKQENSSASANNDSDSDYKAPLNQQEKDKDKDKEQPSSNQSAGENSSKEDATKQAAAAQRERTNAAEQKTPPPEKTQAGETSQNTAMNPGEAVNSDDTDAGKSEQQRVTEQWLRQIPDEPGGLLRRKFDYEYRLRQQRGETTTEDKQW